MIIQYKQFGHDEWKEREVDVFKYDSNCFHLTGMCFDCNSFFSVNGVSDVSVKEYKYNFNEDGDE